VTKDGKGEAVQGLVLGLAGANAQKVVEGVTRKIEDIKPTLPAGIELKVFYNRAQLVEKAVGTVSKALLEATVLVLVLLGAFLATSVQRSRSPSYCRFPHSRHSCLCALQECLPTS
jgi:cobalt-zinc-cadmium resistance protein CzcA